MEQHIYMPLQAYVLDGICQMQDIEGVKAALIQSEKQQFGDGAIRQARIWLVPEPVPPATHRFKYSLVYVVEGVRVIGFDNERGKGDHPTCTGPRRLTTSRVSPSY